MHIKLINITHKPCRTFPTDTVVTVHAGRKIAETKSKDGVLSAEELRWLQDHTLSDATGEHISELNRFYNEMTAIYWVWKNYAELGNPDAIGFMHYRRHFLLSDKLHISGNYADDLGLTPDNLSALMSRYDMIHPVFVSMRGKSFLDSIGHELCSLGGKKMEEAIRIALDIIHEKYPDMYGEIQKIMHGRHTGSLCNMFIMKKELFFEYCEWIFPILFELDKRLGRDYAPGQERCVGWTSEMLTSIFIYLKAKRVSHKRAMVFNQDSITIRDARKIREYRVKRLLSFGSWREAYQNDIFNHELFNHYCKNI